MKTVWLTGNQAIAKYLAGDTEVHAVDTETAEICRLNDVDMQNAKSLLERDEKTVKFWSYEND